MMAGDAAGPADGNPEFGDFTPSNEIERTLLQSLRTGARARLLRTLARSSLCLLAEPPPSLGLASASAGEVRLPCVGDADGRHALLYTSYRQLALANRLKPDAPWLEVTATDLFAKWPSGVDVWLNAGGELGFPLTAEDVSIVADIAAGLEVDEAYEIGPGDDFSDFPGPALPDQVDCAVVLALFDMPAVLEVVRAFRKLEEPDGRTWRIVLVLIDRGTTHDELAHAAVQAVNDASDECCEVHVADINDDEVYDAIAHLLMVGVPLWRREGFPVPDTVANIDLPSLESERGVPDSPAALDDSPPARQDDDDSSTGLP